MELLRQMLEHGSRNQQVITTSQDPLHTRRVLCYFMRRNSNGRRPMYRQTIAVLSPQRITHHETGRSFELGEVLENRSYGTRVAVMPSFYKAFAAGERTLEVVGSELRAFSVREVSLFVVLLRKEFLDIIEPMVKALSPEQIHWFTCLQTPKAESRIVLAGHEKPIITKMEGKCADDRLAGVLVWNLLNRGVASLVAPGSPVTHQASQLPAPEHGLTHSRH